jgi:hypothetical protein
MISSFFEIIIRYFIANIISTVGLYTRYYFLKLIGRNVSIKQLSWKSKDGPKKDGVTMNNIGQVSVNFIVGSIVILFAIKMAVWIDDTYFR